MRDDYLSRIGMLIRDARQGRGYTQAQLLPGYYGGQETSVRMVKAFGFSRTGAL